MSTFTQLNTTNTAKWKALCELADAVSLYRLAPARIWINIWRNWSAATGRRRMSMIA